LEADRTLKLMRCRGIARAVLLAAIAVVATLAIPTGAAAKRGLATGFSDPDEYQGFDTASRPLWMQRTVDSGAQIVRLAVQWDKIARTPPTDPVNPADPAYDFTSVDGPVRDAAAKGLTVLLTINKAPPWAEGPNRPTTAEEGTWRPDVNHLANFSQALATRYSGGFAPAGEPPLPVAQYIEVWDEPNSSDWLSPQFEGKTALSPDYYRSMLNASYRTIKSVNPGIQVVTGGTEPYGDPPGGPYPPGDQRVSPVQFWRQLLCVHQVKTKVKKKKGKKKRGTKLVGNKSCPEKTLFDVFAHHAIDNTGGGPLRSGPRKDDASTPDLGRVVKVLRASEKAGYVPGGKHPVWVTEFWWDSRPPNPVGAPLGTQARWIEQSMYLFWKAGASAAISFQIADSTARPDVHAGLQAGIFFTDGRPKPSFTAFRFPFVTNRINKQKLEVWGRAPEAGKLRIQRKQGKRWRNVRKLKVGQRSVFDVKVKLRGKQRLRATVGDSTSLVWKQS
jgi:hypothetical protein